MNANNMNATRENAADAAATRRNAEDRRMLRIGCQNETLTADALDQRRLAGAVELAAQLTDMNVDRDCFEAENGSSRYAQAASRG